MLMYGDARAADLVADNTDTMVYNITSLNERYRNARLDLLPPNSLGANSEYDYDIKYMEWVFANDAVFMNFMKIILDLYNGLNVFLVITHEDWADMMLESLLKLIQQRYGYNSISIDNPEDIFYAEDTGFNPEYGLINLDQDLARYQYIIGRMGGLRYEE